MRILLDACVPKGLVKHIFGHMVRHATELGWGDLDNGALLDAMSGEFDVLVTVDKGIPNQQAIEHRPVGIAVLRAKTNRLQDLEALVPQLLKVVPRIQAGQVHEISEG